MSIHRRYTDLPSYQERTESTPREFVVRNRRPRIGTIIASFLLVFAGISAAAMSMELLGGLIMFMFFTFVALSLMCWFVVHLTQGNRDLVLITEFQNALFSAVANVHSLFLLIVKTNGTIAYHSTDYQKAFAGARKHGLSSIDSLLESEGISAENAQKIRTAFQEERQEMVFGHITDSEGNRQEVRIIVRPLPRPAGYFLISCSPMRRRKSDQESTEQYRPAHPAPAQLQDAFFVMPLGMGVFTPDGSTVLVHPEIEEWLGYQPGEIAERQLSLPQLLAAVPPGLMEEPVFEAELLFKKRNGALAKAFVVQRAFQDAEGATAGLSLIIAPADRPNPFRTYSIQTSTHTAGEPSAITDTSYISDLLDNAPIGIALLNNQGDIVRYNAFFAGLAERALKIDTPMNLADVVVPEQRDEILRRIRQTMKSSFDTNTKPLTLTLQGNQKNTSLYLARLPSSTEGAIEMVAHLVDTTEQKNLEEKYAHSQKMQAVGQLAGGIAHDFNNLLTAMIGFSDLLLMRHPAGDQSFADIMQIKQNANRAANLVRQLLAFSRRQTLQPKTLDVTDVLAELSDLIRRLIGENIELTMNHGRDLGMIRVDQGQLEQVIINLAVNARDAMKGGGTLSIRTRNVTVDRKHPIPADLIQPIDDEPIVDGDYVAVEVIDTGHGIPQDILTKIFEPFFSTKAIGSGTGLGLATVYGIVKQTGGYIFVRSTPDVGTTFALYFKRFAAEANKPAAGESETIIDAGDLTGKSTILLVEDEAPVRIFSARALRNKGYTVLEADCAEAGLALIREQGDQVELIVTDVIMPGMDGPSMVQEIWQSRPEIDVIFISGYAEDALVKMEGSEHAYHFLAKPFTLKQLAEKVKMVTDKK